MERGIDYVQIARYSLLLGPVVGTLLLLPDVLRAPFLVAALLIIANSQLRYAHGRGVFVPLSLIGEAAAIVYASTVFPGFLFMALFATAIDALRQSKGAVLVTLAIIGPAFVYTARREAEAKWVIILSGLFAIVILLLMQLERERTIREDTEELYDRLSRSNYQLQAARTRLLDYSRQVERVSQLEERNRIARELHDSLGHSLTGVLMQLDAAIHILPEDREKGMKVLRAAHENLRNGLEAVRHTVRRLRPLSHKTHLSSLHELISNFEGATGVKVQFRLDGTPHDLLPSVETALYRNVQEALTNAVRHGQAKHICIDLCFRPEGTSVTIRDDGLGAPIVKKGFGLSGMEERIELIGGSIEFSGQDGFRVSMWVPRKEV